ncbi:MAG: hypothetical protein VB070_11650 [Clostridiaceae bacterium]|nr:hypothetical protein [Clostridiaceae bacterium]
MSEKKANKRKVSKGNSKQLAEDELEQVSGGHIELVEDEAAVLARGMANQGLNTNPLRGDHQS